VQTADARRATFADVFAVREFRALWTSNVLSIIGDRLALVALTILVYERTRSPLMAAVAYAAGYVPWVIGGLTFARVADHKPRRAVMVTCDVVRMFLVAGMLVPGLPVVALVGLLFATTMVAPPFEAARSAIMPDILEGERYVLGIAVIQTTFRTGIVLGAVAGGVAVAVVGPRPALGIDAITFAASALAIGLGTKRRPAAASETADAGQLEQIRGGVNLVFRDQALRTLVLFGWLVALYEIPEGIAAPYAAALHGGAVTTGLLIGSGQVGAMLLTPYFSGHVGPRRRLRWMGPMAVLTCGVLLVAVLRPGLYLSMVIFGVSGTFGIYQIAANSAFVARVPGERRSQAFGVANAGLVVGQGLLFMVAGAAAQKFPPADVVAAGGGLGTIGALLLAARWRRLSPQVGRHKAQQPRATRQSGVPRSDSQRSGLPQSGLPQSGLPQSDSRRSRARRSGGARRSGVPAPRPALTAALAAPVPTSSAPATPSPAPPLPVRRTSPVHARSRTGS
jgi:MFS family permease